MYISKKLQIIAKYDKIQPSSQVRLKHVVFKWIEVAIN